jgi:tetratricopeptide (TPR) repeat protein
MDGYFFIWFNRGFIITELSSLVHSDSCLPAILGEPEPRAEWPDFLFPFQLSTLSPYCPSTSPCAAPLRFINFFTKKIIWGIILLKMMDSLSHRTRHVLIALPILLVAAFLLYAKNFSNEWTYDDYSVLVHNPDIQSVEAFLEDQKPGRPVRELSYLIDYHFFKLDPSGYHIQNIFWHGLNAFLIFCLINGCAGDRRIAWTASLLFLVHPVNVEVVAQISHRKDSLVLVFCLISFISFIKASHSQQHRLPWLLICLAAVVTAYFAKQNAVALPIVFLAYLLVHVDAGVRLAKFKLPLLGVLGIAGVAVLVWYLDFNGRDIFLEKGRIALGRMNYFGPVSEAVYLRMVLKSWLFAFSKFVIPTGLSLEYQYPVPESYLDPWLIGAFLLIAAWGGALVFTRKRSPTAFVFLVWLGAFWLPVSNLWPITNRFAADRYLYTPLVGGFVLVSMALFRFDRKSIYAGIVVLIAVVSLAGLTWKQNDVWRTQCSLWQHAADVNPTSTTALNNLGQCFYRKGEHERAIAFFLRSIEANPHNASPYFNLGLAYEKTGRSGLSRSYYLKFMSIEDPRYVDLIARVKKHLTDMYGPE